jgi:hypothetical protein
MSYHLISKSRSRLFSESPFDLRFKQVFRQNSMPPRLKKVICIHFVKFGFTSTSESRSQLQVPIHTSSRKSRSQASPNSHLVSKESFSAASPHSHLISKICFQLQVPIHTAAGTSFARLGGSSTRTSSRTKSPSRNGAQKETSG